MIVNEFLTILDNKNTAFEGIYRDPAAEIQQLTGLRQQVWNALFDNINSSEHFRIACEIMLVLRNSVVAAWETLDDSRISYTDTDLAEVLAGKGSSITGDAHPLTFLVTSGSPSKQTWTVKYLGGNVMESTDEDGVVQQVTGLIFAPNTWTQFDLGGSQGKAQVLDEPPVNATWTIARDADFNSQINAIAERLEILSVDEVIRLLPADLVGTYRLTPVLQGPLRVAIAAAGVVYGP